MQVAIDEMPAAVVTATRTAQTTSDALASVTVITRSDIDRLQPQSVQDLLTGITGVAIANAGGLGKLTSVFLRGTNSDQLLVLIDGVRAGSVSAGTTAFEQIPVDEIDHIEIVRGPHSSLYGSDAIGGVIQIFTRHGHPDEALTPSFSISGGTYNTWDEQAGLEGGGRNWWAGGSVSSLRTKGINACSGSPSAGCFIAEPQPDKDGYRSLGGSASGGFGFGNGGSASVTWLRNYGHTWFDGDFADNSLVIQQMMGARLQLPELGPWQATLSLGQSEDRSYDNQSGQYGGNVPGPKGFFNTTRNTGSMQNDFMLTQHQRVTVGGDYQKDHIASDSTFVDNNREDVGVFGEYQAAWGNLDTQMSLRGDHDQQFGNHYTGGAAAAYTFSPRLRLNASFGTAYHAPTFNDLYFPGFGNPNLRPEKSRSVEIGLSGRPAPFYYALNLFETFVDNLIALDASFIPSNIDRARIRGLESRIGYDRDGWRVQAGLTLLAPRDETPGPTHGNLLPRRPQEEYQFSVDKHWHTLSAGATFYAAGYRYDDAANLQHLGGYGLSDIRAGWQFVPRFVVEARLANVLGQHYQTARYYNQLGRNLTLTLRYVPKIS